MGWKSRWLAHRLAQGSRLCHGGWVVECTFAWLGNYRRLSKDYEYEVRTSDAMIYVAMIHLMVRRLALLQAASRLFKRPFQGAGSFLLSGRIGDDGAGTRLAVGME